VANPERPGAEPGAVASSLQPGRLSAIGLRLRAGMGGRDDGDGHRLLLTGSAVLVVGAAVQAITGSLFWLIAARTGTTTEVGHASALFTSVLFVSYATGLGLPVAVARYAADRSRQSDVVFTWGLIATTIASAIGSVCYLALFHPPATDVLTHWHGAAGPLLFFVMVVGAAFSLVVDVRFMTVRRWNLVLIRILLVGVIRLPFVALLPDGHRALWLFVLAAGPTAVSGVAGVLLLPRVTGGGLHLRPRPVTARAAARYSLVNYVSTLTYQAPYFVLPVIVLANVPASVNAAFYVAWGITAVAFYVPSAIGQALLAEGGKEGAHLRSQVRLALALAVGLMCIATVGAVAFRGLLTTIYGEDYREAARILPALIGAGVPWAVTSLLLTEARVLHRHVANVAITLALTVAIIVPALVLVPRDGVDGATRAWLFGNLVAAVVAMVATRLGGHEAGGRTVDPILAEATASG
jgi:O-antigen/teichoic acid export membrane protein